MGSDQSLQPSSASEDDSRGSIEWEIDKDGVPHAEKEVAADEPEKLVPPFSVTAKDERRGVASVGDGSGVMSPGWVVP